MTKYLCQVVIILSGVGLGEQPRSFSGAGSSLDSNRHHQFLDRNGYDCYEPCYVRDLV